MFILFIHLSIDSMTLAQTSMNRTNKELFLTHSIVQHILMILTKDITVPYRTVTFHSPMMCCHFDFGDPP